MKKILIVDDDINILKLINIHLTEQGFKVVEAKEGVNALELLSKEKCHLAVVDVMMPFMDGYTLTKEIRSKYNIPIILLTAKKSN